MPAQITELIDKVDNLEIVGDQIAAILAIESANQQVLAASNVPPREPHLWALRVFAERSNPWSEFIDAPEQVDATPIVNVWWDSAEYERGSSNTVERQKTNAVFNVDCYGYGVSTDLLPGGHDPGDSRAGIEAKRVFRLVRNILMSAHYTYLGFPRGASQFVWGRWPRPVQVFQPSSDGRSVQHIVGVRFPLEVSFNEYSPQHKGEPLETLAGEVHRGETGQIYLTAQYNHPTP